MTLNFYEVEKEHLPDGNLRYWEKGKSLKKKITKGYRKPCMKRGGAVTNGGGYLLD